MEKTVFLLAGCVILGFGVFLEVVGNVIMLPGEGVVRAITACTKKEFGLIKICVDLSMSIGALIISLILFHGIQGAVSYTHLDVYKRQVKGNSGR